MSTDDLDPELRCPLHLIDIISALKPEGPAVALGVNQSIAPRAATSSGSQLAEGEVLGRGLVRAHPG